MAAMHPRGELLLFKLITANMNTTADQSFVKQFDFTNYIITRIRTANASTSLSTAAGGIYTAASKGGSALVASGQAYSALTGSTLGVDLTLAAVALGVNTATPILSLTTGQGGAATADLYIIGVPLT